MALRFFTFKNSRASPFYFLLLYFQDMKVLIIGSGGREHALGRIVGQSIKNPELLFAPGNPGMEILGMCHNIPAENIAELLNLAKVEKPDLTIVGPEVPLVMGVVDEFQKAGFKIFGPTKAAARLEGSKAFSKDFMKKYKIPTADFQNFSDYSEAKKYLDMRGAPIVIKASGLAAGKGAIVCPTLEEAHKALDSMLGPTSTFGEAGSEVVIEEFMEGEEASIFVITDGENFRLLPSAQDHKRVFENDEGPNTGGMGAYAPAPIVTPELEAKVIDEVINPTLQGMKAEGCPYTGVLYIGLMIKGSEAKVVEYNCRLGDPETQVVLPIYGGDFLELLESSVENRLGDFQGDGVTGHSAIVVMASGGYPGSYEKGKLISGLDSPEIPNNVHVIHAGTESVGPDIHTNGGRVLGVVGVSDNLSDALDSVYTATDQITFKDCHYRKDIGQKGLARIKSL